MKKIYVFMLTAAALTGCVRGNLEEPSYDDGLALSVGGKEIFKYDEFTWQAEAGNDNVFVMLKDDESCWYRLECDGCPTDVGDEVSGNLSWRTEEESKDSRMKNITLRVSSIDTESGMMHLWSQEKGVAVMVHTVR